MSSNLNNKFFCFQDRHSRIAQVEYQGQTSHTIILDCKPNITAADLAIIFGCNQFRIIPEIFYKLFRTAMMAPSEVAVLFDRNLSRRSLYRPAAGVDLHLLLYRIRFRT